MTRTPCRYDDQIPHFPYNLFATEPRQSHCVNATTGNQPSSTLNTTLCHDTTLGNSRSQLSTPLSATSSGGSYATHPQYSPQAFPRHIIPLATTPTDGGNFVFHQSSQKWSAVHAGPTPNWLPVYASYNISPPTGLTLRSDFSHVQYPARNIYVTPVEDLPQASGNYHSTTSPVGAFPICHSDPSSGTNGGMSNSSRPCQWTEGGVSCNVMVRATRVHMNRHLHAFHGFSGSETRQTRCHWVGCGETMQQGSIARHMVTCHLQAKVTCPMCSKKLSRPDVVSKHQRVCPAAAAMRRAQIY